MKTRVHLARFPVPTLLVVVGFQAHASWLQWSHDPQHTGFVAGANGQPLTTIRAAFIQDTAVPQGLLNIHYTVPLIDDAGNIYLSYRERIGSDIRYGVQALDESGFVHWFYPSDYVSPPAGWEPVFGQAVSSDATGYPIIFVPGGLGVMHVVDAQYGTLLYDIESYDIPPDPGIRNQLRATVFVAAPPTVGPDGTLYYPVLAQSTNPVGLMSHLVKFTLDGTISTVSYSDLTDDPLQRPPLNAAVSIGADGTIFAGSTRLSGPREDWLVAINPDLTRRWQGSMAADPQHAALISDSSTACPAVGPDGRVYYGGTNSNGSQGYLYQFSPDGTFVTYFDFGWDTTPAIYPDPDGDPTHYYLIQKYNRYGLGHFYVTAIDPNTAPMSIVWQWELLGGSELCINAAAVDRNGTTYVNGEDGYAYRIEWGGLNVTRIFLDQPRLAAYTPLSLGNDGTLYTLNNGKMFVVGDPHF
jgi:hypothetical protein